MALLNNAQVPRLIVLNGTYGVQYGNRRSRQFKGPKGHQRAVKIKAAILAGDLSGLSMPLANTERTERISILVHPGSLCGSYETAHDYDGRWRSHARANREFICREFVDFPGTKIVVLGTELDDEIADYPCVHRAVAAATERYIADTLAQDLHKAALDIWKAHKQTASSFFITGAWADPEDGCAWHIHKSLQKLASGNPVTITLDPKAARESDIDNIDD